MPSRREADSLLLRMAPALGRAYLRVTGLLTRYRFEGQEEVERARGSGGPVVSACWHNRLLGPVLPHEGKAVGVVISQSEDGELISRVVAGFGYVPLRGSSSRGGASALRAVLRHVRRGLDVVFTPDGPRGPRYVVQPGVAFAARALGVPFVPVGVAMSRKLVFRSWDRFQVPLPFGRIQIVYGPALRFTGSSDDGAAAEAIRSALVTVTERAERLLGVSSP